MASSKHPSNTPSDPKAVTDAFRSVHDSLISRGDAVGLEKLYVDVARELGLEPEAVATQTAVAIEGARERCRRLGPDIQDAATAAGIRADVKLPHVSIGCVSFQENPRRPGEWTLSILDNFPVETVKTMSGKVLVERATARIAEIDGALKRTEQFAADLLEAFDFVQAGSSGPVSANLLMLMTSFGKHLRNTLASTVPLSTERALSRAQFGFLLTASSQSESSRLHERIRFNGATQVETRQHLRYVSVPESPDPKTDSKSRKITSLTITRGKPE